MKVIIPVCQSQADEQDIPPESTPSGIETTGHRKRKKRRGRRKIHPRERDDWLPNPYGKYVSTSAVKKYIKHTENYYAPITNKERARKGNRICRAIEDLGGPGNPTKITDEHVKDFVNWMETQSMNNETKRKYIRFLRDYLIFYENYVVDTMLAKKQIRMPKHTTREIRSMSVETMDAIHEAAKHMNGWRGSVARFITMAYRYTGLRPSELRTLRFQDVNTETWILTVSHPKGEGLYGVNRRIWIYSPLRPAFEEFLEKRREYLASKGYQEDVEPLIPWKGHGGIKCWQESGFWTLKRELEDKTGINFKLKDYRSSFCQWLIDQDAKLEAVSKIMGHKTSKTTESYYGRIRDDAANAEIERVFSESALKI